MIAAVGGAHHVPDCHGHLRRLIPHHSGYGATVAVVTVLRFVLPVSRFMLVMSSERRRGPKKARKASDAPFGPEIRAYRARRAEISATGSSPRATGPRGSRQGLGGCCSRPRSGPGGIRSCGRGRCSTRQCGPSGQDSLHVADAALAQVNRVSVVGQQYLGRRRSPAPRATSRKHGARPATGPTRPGEARQGSHDCCSHFLNLLGLGVQAFRVSSAGR